MQRTSSLFFAPPLEELYMSNSSFFSSSYGGALYVHFKLTNWLPDLYFFFRGIDSTQLKTKLLSLKIETSIVIVEIIFQVCVSQIMCITTSHG